MRGGSRSGAGRKPVHIDLVELEKLSLLHCTDEEIASWFGVYAHERFGMGSLAIGAAYLAFGVVGSVSPLAGVLADRIGRSRRSPR